MKPCALLRQKKNMKKEGEVSADSFSPLVSLTREMFTISRGLY